MTSDFFIV